MPTSQTLLFQTTDLVTVEQRMLRSGAAPCVWSERESAIFSLHWQGNPALRGRARRMVRDMAQRFHFIRTG